MAWINSVFVLVYMALVLYGAWSDARTLRIPNWVSLSLLAAFFPAVLTAQIGLEAIAWHLAAGVVVLIGGIVLFAFGLFGGGDAKLMTGVALWLGWDQMLWLLAVIVLVGGILSILVILLRKGLGIWPQWLVQSAKGLFEPNAAVPYGIAIAAGALILLPRLDTLPPVWLDVFDWVMG
ncbi:MAG: prepilin peptidase [Magnetovibrio sp.]|nr:prepilin peptidase [Magnetovibrio sp.]